MVVSPFFHIIGSVVLFFFSCFWDGLAGWNMLKPSTSPFPSLGAWESPQAVDVWFRSDSSMVVFKEDKTFWTKFGTEKSKLRLVNLWLFALLFRIKKWGMIWSAARLWRVHTDLRPPKFPFHTTLKYVFPAKRCKTKVNGWTGECWLTLNLLFVPIANWGCNLFAIWSHVRGRLGCLWHWRKWDVRDTLWWRTGPMTSRVCL